MIDALVCAGKDVILTLELGSTIMAGLRGPLQVLTSLALFVGLAACQPTVDSVDAHLTESNASADNFRNQAILLNILRAEQNAPLSFINISSIPTQYNHNVNVGLPGFEIGPLKVQSGRPFTWPAT